MEGNRSPYKNPRKHGYNANSTQTSGYGREPIFFFIYLITKQLTPISFTCLFVIKSKISFVVCRCQLTTVNTVSKHALKRLLIMLGHSLKNLTSALVCSHRLANCLETADIGMYCCIEICSHDLVADWRLHKHILITF